MLDFLFGKLKFVLSDLQVICGLQQVGQVVASGEPRQIHVCQTAQTAQKVLHQLRVGFGLRSSGCRRRNLVFLPLGKTVVLGLDGVAHKHVDFVICLLNLLSQDLLHFLVVVGVRLTIVVFVLNCCSDRRWGFERLRSRVLQHLSCR